MRDFEGRVAVVTGGASGIGKAMGRRFGREGMRVVLVDVEAPALEATVAELRREELDVTGMLADVGNYEAVERLADETFEQYGDVHVLCNNAGVGGGGGNFIWEHSLKDWHWTFDVNLWGVVHGIKAFVPRMLEHGEPGHVVNTASIAGLTAGAHLDIYGATKHAVVRISESLHLQFAEVGAALRASVLCPGYVQTRIGGSLRNRPDEMWDADRRPTAEEIARRVREGEERMRELGIPPDDVAEAVLNAIREERFWILTHADFDGAIRLRMENILERRNPELMQPNAQAPVRPVAGG